MKHTLTLLFSFLFFLPIISSDFSNQYTPYSQYSSYNEKTTTQQYWICPKCSYTETYEYHNFSILGFVIYDYYIFNNNKYNTALECISEIEHTHQCKGLPLDENIFVFLLLFTLMFLYTIFKKYK